jgi:putative addiction module killer protein
MYQLEQTDRFKDWVTGLRDNLAKARIAARLTAAAAGNFGDSKPVGEGVFEMRIDVGPGYRLYYTRIGVTVFMMLVGGNKSTQQRDIKVAIQMAKELKS